MATNFALGAQSLARLAGVHPALIGIVKRAIQITAQDFAVHDGLRTIAQQLALVNRGASKTMNSKHLPQPDGLGHAVDLVPYINGQLRWEWEPIYDIAVAFDQAATEQGLAARIVWGGIWDRNMGQYGNGTDVAMRDAVAAYCARHPGPDFIDGPHYQIS